MTPTDSYNANTSKFPWIYQVLSHRADRLGALTQRFDLFMKYRWGRTFGFACSELQPKT